jgi:hypothetical protein
MRETLDRERAANSALLAAMRPVEPYLPVLGGTDDSDIQVTPKTFTRPRRGFWRRIGRTG